MSDQPIFSNTIKDSAGIKLSILFGSFFFMLILASIIGAGIENLPFGDSREKQLGISVIQSVFAFCIPAYLLSKFSSSEPAHWLRLDKSPSFRHIIGIIIVYIITLPAMEWIIEWNNNIHFPEFLSKLEVTLREWEDSNNAIAIKLLNMNGWFEVVVGVLVIGIITGFSEELFFRGGLQGLLERSSIPLFWSVWISAFIFSSMHFQFFGFFPRLLMGAFFGFLLLWTSNLWTSIFAHVLNNSVVVIVSAVGGNEVVDGISSSFVGYPFFLPIISLAVTIIFFVCFRKYFFGSEK